VARRDCKQILNHRHRVIRHHRWERINAAGLADAITPVNMDARNILLPKDYFGTDDLYLPYLTQDIRPGGRISIASPCYAHELTPETDEVFLYDPPHHTESLVVHSPEWWRHQFEAPRMVRVLECQKHPPACSMACLGL